MKNKQIFRARAAFTSAIVIITGEVLFAPAGLAQSTEARSSETKPSGDEIIVTARRRDETLISVPVTVAAMGAKDLNARGITTLDGFALTVPSLFLTASGASVQGGAIGLRGISTTDGNNFGDQAVAFEMDGVLIARSTPRRFSDLDVAQIQVLKGPQALFFGKNSPAGVIVVRSADPTSNFEAGMSGQYEFNARAWRLTSFVSTPLTDSLGLRIAGMASNSLGWAHNVATPGTIYEPDSRRGPKNREFATRVTLKFDNGGPFNARFKFTYGNSKTSGIFANDQRVDCPLGTGQLGGPDDCTADDRYTQVNFGTRFGTGGANTVTGAAIAGNPYYGNGKPYLNQTQYLGGLELTYRLSDQFSLTSTTGYYDVKTEGVDSASAADTTFPVGPGGVNALGGFLPSYSKLDIREVSQELRLRSDLGGPIDFVIGGFFQDQKLDFITATSGNAINPISLYPTLRAQQRGTAYSAFGSVVIKPIATFEISGGLRYSHERKSIIFSRVLPGVLPASQGGAAFGPGDVVPTVVPRKTFNNVSPEVTLTWRPNDKTTLFGGWRRGFLSGGFSPTGTGSNVAVLPDRSYGQEVVEGFEGGAKVILLDNTLRLNAAVYSYKIEGLQLQSTLAATGAQILTNAADARSKGAEIDLNWTTPLTGLELKGGLAYNRARYRSYPAAPCYGGQSVSAGCNLNFANNKFNNQDLAGRPVVRAPEFGASIGANYEASLGGERKLDLSVDGTYSSSFYGDANDSPGSLQKAYWLLDASARFVLKDGIEFALVGRNLTNTYYFARTSDVPFTGSGAGTPNAVRSDTYGIVNQGRQIIVRATVHFR